MSHVSLGHYTAPDGAEPREIVSTPGAGESTLVIDRLAGTHADARLVAHLAADEPLENARIVCEMYLIDQTRGRCRAVTTQNLEQSPLAPSRPTADRPSSPHPAVLDAGGHSYRIREVSSDDDFPQLRWTRSRHPGCDVDFDQLTLRDVIARLEDYEPARTLTAQALALHREDPRVSTCQLQQELRPRDRQPHPAQPWPARSRAAQGRARRNEHERDRVALRARQARPSRQHQRRDQLARPPHRPATRGRRGRADAVDPHRCLGAHHPSGPRRQPSRDRSRLMAPMRLPSLTD